MNKAIILFVIFDVSLVNALLGQNGFEQYPRVRMQEIEGDLSETTHLNFQLPEFTSTILDCFSSSDQLKKNRNFYFTYSSCFGKRGWEVLARVSVTRKNFFGLSFSRRIVKKAM